VFIGVVAPAMADSKVIYGVNDGFASSWPLLGASASALGIGQVATNLEWSCDGSESDAPWTIPETQEVLLVLAGRPRCSPATERARAAFCSYARALVDAHPNIREIEIWNEPTQRFMWRGSLWRYMKLLARCYDALPRRVTVLAPGAAPNANVRSFAQVVGRFYRRVHRRRPLFDGYATHPYWGWDARTTSSAARTMDRAWRGLPQPSPRRGLRFWWTETGMESTTAANRPGYYGTQDYWRASMIGSPRKQAERVRAVALRAYCDPLVTADFHFLLVDEPNLSRWQSGLLYVDGTPKPAFFAFEETIGLVQQRPAQICPRPTVLSPVGDW
jgi:hypothetical protein